MAAAANWYLVLTTITDRKTGKSTYTTGVFTDPRPTPTFDYDPSKTDVDTTTLVKADSCAELMAIVHEIQKISSSGSVRSPQNVKVVTLSPHAPRA